MIKIIDTTTKLRENKRELIDKNAIINETMSDLIVSIKKEINKISNKYDATVSVSGKIDKPKFSIKGDDETASVIQSLIDNYLN